MLAEPDLADIAAFGRHPLQGSLVFRNYLFFPLAPGLGDISCVPVPRELGSRL